jgi:hypothetical protein
MAAEHVRQRSAGPRWRRRGVATLFVAVLAYEVLMPLTGLVDRWHDGDGDGYSRYSWHMYSRLDRYRGN